MNRATALLDWAFSSPDRDCIITATERYSFFEVRAAVISAACRLGDRVGTGTRVGLFIDSTPNFVVYEYAAFYVGAVVTPINRAMKAAEVRRLVARLGIEVVVADTPLDLGDSTFVHLVGPEFDAGDGEFVRPAEVGVDDPALVLQTSGSTGEPKGVILAVGNLVANYDATYRWIGVGRTDTILLTLPVFNTYALNQGVNMMAMSGATMYLMQRFTPEAVAQALETVRPTVMPLVPTMVTRLRQEGVRYSGPIKVGIAAAPSPTRIAADAWEVFPQAHLYMAYGLTEATAIVSLNHLGTRENHHKDFSTTGPIVSGVEVRISQSGESGDERGEILVRGESVLHGYIGTDEPIPVEDGWLHTGDVGVLDDGRLTIVDRVRDLIIRGGQNIYPGEVELAITSHPDVLEAAVVGRHDDDLGEIPVAYVVARRGTNPHPDILRAWVSERLAAFKVPTAVHVVHDLPQTPTGKIRRRALAEKLAATDSEQMNDHAGRNGLGERP
jgi:long-chain acyl-CoA synthetase